MLGNYSRFIRPGMVRVDLSGPQNLHGVLGTAYLNPTTGRLVLVNNTATPQRVELRFRANTRKPATFTLYITSASKDLAAEKPFNSADDYVIPPQIVATLVGTDMEKLKTAP